ncbi:MAG: hypothetical protein HZB33_16270 [Nitrospirae bacterium]|nr:hypothetical protein [Nitrospirota bacterium]
MVIGRPVISGLSGRTWLTTAGVYLASYILLQYSGLPGPRPENIMRVLHTWPAMTGVAALLLAGVSRSYALRSGQDSAVPGGGRFTRGRLSLWGMLLFGAGLLLSSLTRIEGSVTLSEGQEVSLSSGGFDSGTLYRRSFSKEPEGSLLVAEVSQFISDKGRAKRMYEAGALYSGTGKGPLDLRLNSLYPRFAGGFMFEIKDAGYSPHVFLFDPAGNMIDNFYAVLQLSPPGAEDSFRFDRIIPHTIYLKYYPEASLFPDAAAASGIKSGPLFKVRIARNLDVVADRYAAPDDAVYFDKLVFSAGDMRKWVEVRIVRDPGIYLLFPGVILMVIGALSHLLKSPESLA